MGSKGSSKHLVKNEAVDALAKLEDQEKIQVLKYVKSLHEVIKDDNRNKIPGKDS